MKNNHIRVKNKPVSLKIIENIHGPKLVCSEDSGVNILTVDGMCFKDLSKDGKLDPYEDWRLSPEIRAKDLAARLTVEQIAGLMLYTECQSVPMSLMPINTDTYFGAEFEQAGVEAWNISDAQYDYILKKHGRHMLVGQVKDKETGAAWYNSLQQLAESCDYGIPVNMASDPRHGIDHSVEFNMGSGGNISVWPEALGLAATFDPDLVREAAEIFAREYRALGITTALHPQIDLGTEPRWMRFKGTFGESPDLSADMARAYCEGLQTSYGDDEIASGWGMASVNAMVKHWPGGGTGEAGRDAHFDYGKYAVYPGNNFQEHLIPFTEGAFQLSGGTKKAGAVMPYYTISYGQDPRGRGEYANGFSEYIINDLLRVKYDYDGIVCTDWLITEDSDGRPGRCWSMEDADRAQRHFKAIMAGVDQFGGQQEPEPIIEAFERGCRAFGQKSMTARMRISAERILTVIFRMGLFENPYLNAAHTAKIVGCEGHMKKGFEAQCKSVIMVKNKREVLPVRKRKKVYIPEKFIPGGRDWFGGIIPEQYEVPVSQEIVGHYFEIADTPEEADFGLMFLDRPDTGFPFDDEELKNGGNGYLPISLQYESYQAKQAREISLAGDEQDDGRKENRCYKDKVIEARNKANLDILKKTKASLGNKPLIVSVYMSRPCIVSEFEKEADAILINFGVQPAVILELVSGRTEPSGLLPMQIPASMETVEQQAEDVPFDTECHSDSEGHVYDFAFGMSWQGVIDDYRVRRYSRRF